MKNLNENDSTKWYTYIVHLISQSVFKTGLSQLTSNIQIVLCWWNQLWFQLNSEFKILTLRSIWLPVKALFCPFHTHLPLAFSIQKYWSVFCSSWQGWMWQRQMPLSVNTEQFMTQRQKGGSAWSIHTCLYVLACMSAREIYSTVKSHHMQSIAKFCHPQITSNLGLFWDPAKFPSVSDCVPARDWTLCSLCTSLFVCQTIWLSVILITNLGKHNQGLWQPYRRHFLFVLFAKRSIIFLHDSLQPIKVLW